VSKRWRALQSLLFRSVPQSSGGAAEENYMSAIGNISSSYLQQALLSALQSAGIAQNSGSTSRATSPTQQSDSSQLSPFAQLAGILQQLQQSNPTKYAQVTEQISTNLQTAAQTAQSQGNTNAAGQLTQLASDFSTASQSGQLPNLQDLAQAVGGGGGGHHHHRRAESSSSSSDSSSSTSSSSSGQLSQLLSALQANSSQSGQNASSLDPGAIIFQTLASAGINVSNS
jgi:hypothetical protein